MSTAREAAILAMTVVKNEANDSALHAPGSRSQGTWSVEDGADRFLKVLADRGYVLAAKPAATASTGLEELAMKAEEYIEAVVSYLDEGNQFTHSRRRHVDRTGEELAELTRRALAADGTET